MHAGPTFLVLLVVVVLFVALLLASLPKFKTQHVVFQTSMHAGDTIEEASLLVGKDRKSFGATPGLYHARDI